jgi:23S rRNA (uracil-5-)-methyltransferase RumA
MAGEEQISGVCINLNSEKGNRILGEQTFCVAGQSYIEEVLKSDRPDYPAILRLGLSFQLSSTSFFQINTRQAVKLLEVVYDEVKRLTESVEKPLIVDAFSGVGAIGFWLAPLAGTVVAIEDHANAVEDGKSAAERNAIDNVEFVQGRVEQILPALLSEGRRPDLIVVDPPRQGLSEAVLRTLEKADCDVVYVSCNPATLARDLKFLRAGDHTESNRETMGYKIKQIQPVDLFPQTYHVESVTTLERLRSNGAVRNMEEA